MGVAVLWWALLKHKALSLQYLVEVIRDQQLSEWCKEQRYDGTPQDNSKRCMHIHIISGH